ncbi:MAG TPA: lipocalin family protein [Flavobacteriaceae bacterium]|nr:lipocalin family protein [Flavobacteriaceae bacterium]
MKKCIYLLLFFVLLACSRQTPQEKIENLNGYWAISKVETKNGKTKEYPAFNSLVDYIEINDNKGFRKKVKPKIDGSFLVTDDSEKIIVKVENDNINLYYSTGLDEWKETLIASEENKIVLQNEEGIEYSYKRFTGYLNEHGKKKQ